MCGHQKFKFLLKLIFISIYWNKCRTTVMHEPFCFPRTEKCHIEIQYGFSCQPSTGLLQLFSKFRTPKIQLVIHFLFSWYWFNVNVDISQITVIFSILSSHLCRVPDLFGSHKSIMLFSMKSGGYNGTFFVHWIHNGITSGVYLHMFRITV